MSKKQHQMDVNGALGHNSTHDALVSGSCLNSHMSNAASNLEKRCSCSYRWQAYEQMHDDKKHYDYPRYVSLVNHPTAYINVAMKGLRGRKQHERPRMYEWDWGHRVVRYMSVKGQPEPFKREFENFFDNSFAPYNHQSHHLIPDSVLSNSIRSVFKDRLERLVRQGLLKEKYNLNFKTNMMILPMDKQISDSIGLPLHVANWMADHPAWSRYVQSKVEAAFQKVDDAMDFHEIPDYQAARDALEKLSENLRQKVFATQRGSLDELASSMMPSVAAS